MSKKNKIIPQAKLIPFEKTYRKINNYDSEDISNKIYPQCNIKKNKIAPEYFYQKKQVCDIPSNIKELSGNKQIKTPLIKNIKVNHEKKDINQENIIRSQFSRLDTLQFQKEKESIINDRFQFLTKNFQDPNKLVLPFPRGGEITREKYYKNMD